MHPDFTAEANNALSEPTAFVRIACNVWDSISDVAKYEWFINGAAQFVDCVAKLTCYTPTEEERDNVYTYITPFGLGLN